MNKKILAAAVAAAVLSVVFFVLKSGEDVQPHVDSVEQPASDLKKNEISPAVQNKSASPSAENSGSPFEERLDADKWLYDKDEKVYYLEGVLYARTNGRDKYRKMSLYVPEQYLDCVKKGFHSYSCKPDKSGRAGDYAAGYAPFVFEVETPGFAADPALKKYGNRRIYTDSGMIYVHIGFRGTAPLGVADIKTAVRYLRRNKDLLPGDTDEIYALAVNEGSLAVAAAGASGNSRLYEPYMQENGAFKGIDDDISGVMLINPVSAPDTANEALEWLSGAYRKDMTAEQQKFSEKSAEAYARYVNKAGFTANRQQALTLQYSASGAYREGTYYDFFASVIRDSFAAFIHKHTFPYVIPQSWAISEAEAADGNIKLSGNIKSSEDFIRILNSKGEWVFNYAEGDYGVKSVDDFLRIFKRKVPEQWRYDNPEANSPLNVLFGTGGRGLHFDGLSARISSVANITQDLNKRDSAGYTTLQRINLYNPLYYLLPSYGGYNTAKAAPFWYIKDGLFRDDDILTAPVNLYLALSACKDVKKVRYDEVWGMGSVSGITDADRKDFAGWIAEVRKTDF